MKKIVVVNAGPRKNWNTDKLLQAAASGASAQGAEIKYYDLYRMSNIKGCVSCFGCKTEASFGKCICRDDLYDVLEEIRTADALIMGSPNYLGNLTAAFRALYERLVFQVLTYNKEKPNCNPRRIPVLLIMTSNCSEAAYGMTGYDKMLEGYQATLSNFVGPTEVFVCGDTLQVKDYSKYDWTMFDPDAKKKHHDETFADYEAKAYELGEKLVQ